MLNAARRWLPTILLATLLLWTGADHARAQDAAPETQAAAAVESPPAVAPPTVAPSGVANAGEIAHEGGGHAAGAVSILWSIPFALLLGSIALMPFISAKWWHHNYPYVAIALGLVATAYYVVWSDSMSPWIHGMQEYVSFVILLGSLYIVSGGIAITLGRKATPRNNVALLLIGAVMSNIVGTTGASMLLIRPFIRVNRGHLKPYHVVFFIFIVSNVGGSLTPIGDPPLFLGYLRGIPFWWVFEHCFVPWAVVVSILLLLFWIIDKRDYRAYAREHPGDNTMVPVHIIGLQNFPFILLVLIGVFMPGLFEIIHDARSHAMLDLWRIIYCREVLMVAAAVLSRITTREHIYKINGFNYEPIKEVAILFIGIFATMAPALQWLEHNAERLPVKTPGQFYFATGVLSSFLDNAPTYVTFLQARLSELDPEQVQQATAALQAMGAEGTLNVPAEITDPDVRAAIWEEVKAHPDRVLEGRVTMEDARVSFLLGIHENNVFIVAISLGAVFFGACTYIGNGPNFMVKSIAEASGVAMPTFFGYVLRFALPVLIPVYILVWYLFFNLRLGM